MNYSFWYDKTFPDLSGYGIWLRGGELNTLPAAEFEDRPFRVLITRLSTYRDTADSFTHKLLYQIISRINGAYPDLAYLPPPKDILLFDRDNVPWLLGTASKRRGRDFSVIALSLSVVQELVNVKVMLEKSGIPLSKQERMNDPDCPLVLLGGASALYTSVLFNDDPLVDGIFAGGDARIITRLFQTCKDGYDHKLPKRAVLDELRKIPCFFLPEVKPVAKIFQAAELPQEQLLEAGPVLYEESCIGRANLQISEGCRCFCSFCAESFCRKPYREFRAEHLREAALRLKAAMGAHDLELYSFNFSMHSDFYRILRELAELFPSIGLKSQRFDSFASDPELVKFLHAVGKTSITCGMEGISPRLRRYLHKSLGEPDLKKSLSVLLASPIRELKIFLIATGLEQQEDYDDFRKLLALMQARMHASGRLPPRIIFSMTVLVRFPWTPLEFEDAPDQNTVEAVLRATERIVHDKGFEFRASSDSNDYWISQLLARAHGPRIAKAFGKAIAATRFVYYRDVPRSFVETVKMYLQREGISTDAVLKGFMPSDRTFKPWVALETGVSETLLARQWGSAKRFMDKGIECNRSAAKGYSLDAFRNALRTAKAQEGRMPVLVHIEPAMAGVPHAMRGTVLARALMLADRDLVYGYRGYGGSAAFDRLGSNWVIGDDLLTLIWTMKAIERLKDLIQDPAFIEKVNKELVKREELKAIQVSDAIEIIKIIFRSPYRFDPAGYCEKKSLKFTLNKSGPDTWRYVLSKGSLKKKIFSLCTARHEAGGNGCCTITVTPGPKFIPEEFARTAFRFSGENEWVRIEMMAHFS